MTNEELGKLYPIILEEYNKNWPIYFKKEKKNLESIFGKMLKIEHIGSTAIKGILAKPTVDILLERPTGLSKEQIILIMEEHGYIHMKEQARYLMFVKGYTSTGLEKESFHIHIGPLSQDWLWDRVYFRDYLIDNPDEAKRYEGLKTRLSGKYKNDREAYTDGKAEYIRRITDKAKKVGK